MKVCRSLKTCEVAETGCVLSMRMLGFEGIRQLTCIMKNVTKDRQNTTLGLMFDKVDESIRGGIEEYVRKVAHYLEN